MEGRGSSREGCCVIGSITISLQLALISSALRSLDQPLTVLDCCLLLVAVRGASHLVVE